MDAPPPDPRAKHFVMLMVPPLFTSEKKQRNGFYQASRKAKMKGLLGKLQGVRGKYVGKLFVERTGGAKVQNIQEQAMFSKGLSQLVIS